MRGLCLAIVIAVAAPVASSQTHDVAVLPWVTAEVDLKPYSMLIARAVTGELRRRSKLRYRLSQATGQLPARSRLVIDGRLLTQEDGVMLEAQVRNPARGTVVHSYQTSVRPLVEMEELASDMAASLATVMDELMAVASANRNFDRRAKASANRTTMQVPTKTAPIVLVATMGGRGQGGRWGRSPAASRAAREYMETLALPAAHRVVAHGGRPAVLQLLAEHDGQFAISIELDEIIFRRRFVLTAKGGGRVNLYDRFGKLISSARLTTDTLVGSRGDRHEALVYFAVRQLTEKAGPVIEKQLHALVSQ